VTGWGCHSAQKPSPATAKPPTSTPKVARNAATMGSIPNGRRIQIAPPSNTT
jgi:hypothetical protein